MFKINDFFAFFKINFMFVSNKKKKCQLCSLNKINMNNSFLYTVPQWIIFSGIVAVIYGWLEQKEQFRIIGTSILIVLGLFSVYVFFGDFLAAYKYLTPYEAAMLELEEQEMLSAEEMLFEEIPFQVKIFPAYISFLISG